VHVRREERAGFIGGQRIEIRPRLSIEVDTKVSVLQKIIIVGIKDFGAARKGAGRCRERVEDDVSWPRFVAAAPTGRGFSPLIFFAPPTVCVHGWRGPSSFLVPCHVRGTVRLSAGRRAPSLVVPVVPATVRPGAVSGAVAAVVPFLPFSTR